MTVQRISDVLLAVVLLLICLPVMVLTCLFLLSERAEAPIFRAERLLPSGKRVRLFRLRIAEKTPFGLRLTRSGAFLRRLHLDQVPMLLNVLKGDLTLLGAEQDGVASSRMLAERHPT